MEKKNLPQNTSQICLKHTRTNIIESTSSVTKQSQQLALAKNKILQFLEDFGQNETSLSNKNMIKILFNEQGIEK